MKFLSCPGYTTICLRCVLFLVHTCLLSVTLVFIFTELRCFARLCGRCYDKADKDNAQATNVLTVIQEYKSCRQWGWQGMHFKCRGAPTSHYALSGVFRYRLGKLSESLVQVKEGLDMALGASTSLSS